MAEYLKMESHPKDSLRGSSSSPPHSPCTSEHDESADSNLGSSSSPPNSPCTSEYDGSADSSPSSSRSRPKVYSLHSPRDNESSSSSGEQIPLPGQPPMPDFDDKGDAKTLLQNEVKPLSEQKEIGETGTSHLVTSIQDENRKDENKCSREKMERPQRSREVLAPLHNNIMQENILKTHKKSHHRSGHPHNKEN